MKRKNQGALSDFKKNYFKKVMISINNKKQLEKEP